MLDYSAEQLDMIREISNIALGNSATSLYKLLNAKISMSVPSINIEPISDFIGSIKETEVIGKILMLKGDFEGSVLVLFEIDTAKRIVSNVAEGKYLPQDELDDIKVSFIEEVCNIVGSTYVRHMADYLNLKIEIENSSLLYDNLTAILSYIFMEEEQFYDEIVNIQTDFKYEVYSKEMDVYFYFIPRKGKINKLFNHNN